MRKMTFACIPLKNCDGIRSRDFDTGGFLVGRGISILFLLAATECF